MAASLQTVPPQTVHAAFARTAAAHPDKPFLAVPAKAGRDYFAAGFEIGYAQALARVETLIAAYANAGYGHGHRVAVMLDNQPAHFLHLLALNALGVSMVPVNPDYVHGELVYLLEHSEAALAVILPKYEVRMALAATGLERAPAIVVAEPGLGEVARLPQAGTSPPLANGPNRASEAGILYTSGTTGRPKGCVLDNDYYLTGGQWYADIGGAIALRPGFERVISPLPLFHMNTGIILPMALIATANCQILPDRFSPSTWWEECVTTQATAFHYLGIVPPILMKQPVTPAETAHTLAWGLGAGIDPAIHAAFERRFGVAMVEVWGMTETGRIFADAYAPRAIATRAFGRPHAALQAKVVDADGVEVPRGTQGQLLVRCAGENPRAGFFRGYLKDVVATDTAWRTGWFHTGDVVIQQADGMLVFVERQKNIIRRSGENISAADVESALIGHDLVRQVAVLAVADELRDEEVMAAIVLAPGYEPEQATAEAIVAWAREHLAFYKLPGWIAFVETLPTTSTQKVQKGLIFPADSDPRTAARCFDVRALKVRVKG